MWELKKHCKLLAVQIAAKLPAPKYFAPYDLMVTSIPHYISYFKKAGKNAEFLKLAFENSILEKLQEQPVKYDITHIGGYGEIHNERNLILEKVAEVLKLDTWGYATKNLNPDSPILKNFHGEAWGIEMFNILYNSKITITGHIKKVARNYANNMTLYEATGVGCLLMTVMKDNLGEIFEVGKEVVAYQDADDLIEKIRYYLNHEEERKQIAEAGQRRTLQDHNYKNRSEELIAILSRYL
jgi:glycosyltransferase involved in cell wall biosynthesis